MNKHNLADKIRTNTSDFKSFIRCLMPKCSLNSMCSNVNDKTLALAMLPFLLLSFLLSTVLYFYLTWDFNYWRKRGIDGPKPLPYLGTYPLSACFRKNILDEMDELYR